MKLCKGRRITKRNKGGLRYLAILYGFLEWQVPEKILLLPAVPDALKAFEGDFLSALDERLAAEAGENEAPAGSETETADR